MSLDDRLWDEADRALALRFGRLLLLAPLVTVPLTAAFGMAWLDPSIILEHRTFGDVILLHLPGLVNAYPAWELARRWIRGGPAGRAQLAIAAVGLLTYLVPNLIWLIVVDHWHRVPPLVSDPRVVLAVATQSTMHSLVLWILLLSIYRGLQGDEPRPLRHW